MPATNIAIICLVAIITFCLIYRATRSYLKARVKTWNDTKDFNSYNDLVRYLPLLFEDNIWYNAHVVVDHSFIDRISINIYRDICSGHIITAFHPMNDDQKKILENKFSEWVSQGINVKNKGIFRGVNLEETYATVVINESERAHLYCIKEFMESLYMKNIPFENCTVSTR